MEAKDTVISDEQLQEYIPAGVYGKELAAWELFQKELAEAQAEITWIPAFGEGKRQGIEEVVEWLKSNELAPKSYFLEWRTKLEEWGIDQP